VRPERAAVLRGGTITSAATRGRWGPRDGEKGGGEGGGEASCAINQEFEVKGIGCHEAWPSSALRPGGTGKPQLEHGGAKLEVQRGRSAGRLEDEVVLEVN
jgi:hypothetical protein